MNLALTLADTAFPVRLRFDRAMTDEELMRFCAANEVLRVEREPNGEITIMSPTGSQGSSIEADVALELGIWARQDGRGRSFNSNAGFTLPEGSVRAADAAWMSWSRWNAVPQAEREGFARLCPEFVIEVRSKSDRLGALREKMEMWIANGAELAWLIDPERRVVEVYRPGEAAEMHENPSSVLGDGPVLKFELVMDRVWG